MAEVKSAQSDVLAYLNKCERIGREYQESSGQVDRWRNALNAWYGLVEALEDDTIMVNINYMRNNTLNLWARDCALLLSERPHFPLETDEREADEAKMMEDLLDKLLEEGGYYAAKARLYLLKRGFGKAYIEPRYERELRRSLITVPTIDPVTGMMIGEQKTVREYPYECVRHYVHMPWSVLRPEHGESLTQCHWMQLKELVDFSEIEKRIDEKRYKVPDDVDTAALKQSPGMRGFEEWSEVWRRDLGARGGQRESDTCVLIRHFENPSKEYKNGRWLTMLNYSTVLEDTENQNYNMDLKQKPVIGFYDTPVIGPDCEDTLGTWDNIEQRATLANDLRSIYLNDLLMTLDPHFFFDPMIISPSAMQQNVKGPIPLLPGGQGRKLQEAVMEIPRQRPPEEMQTVIGEQDQAIDKDLGLYYTQTGEPAPRKETFGATQIIAGAGEAYLTSTIRIGEQTSEAELAMYDYKLVDAHVGYLTVERLLGEEKAQVFRTSDPTNLKYGHKLNFQGSNMVAKKQADNEALLKWWDLFGNDPMLDPTMNPEGAKIPRRKITRKVAQFDDSEIEKMWPEGQPMPMQPPMGPDGMPMQPPAQPGMESMSQTQGITPAAGLSTPSMNSEAAVAA